MIEPSTEARQEYPSIVTSLQPGSGRPQRPGRRVSCLALSDSACKASGDPRGPDTPGPENALYRPIPCSHARLAAPPSSPELVLAPPMLRASRCTQDTSGSHCIPACSGYVHNDCFSHSHCPHLIASACCALENVYKLGLRAPLLTSNHEHLSLTSRPPSAPALVPLRKRPVPLASRIRASCKQLGRPPALFVRSTASLFKFYTSSVDRRALSPRKSY